MQISKIGMNNYHNRNHNLNRNINFGLKISENAETVFYNLAKKIDSEGKADDYKLFKETMEKLRATLPSAGIISRKDGTGICISVPAVFKTACTKTIDKKLPYLGSTSQPLESVKKALQDVQMLEAEYNKKCQYYEDITGHEYMPPEEFLESQLI